MAPELLQTPSLLQTAVLASIAAGAATGIGALPVFLTRSLAPRLNDALLGFAAGVMLAATAFSLIVPALSLAGGGLAGAAVVAVGLATGAVFLDLVDRYAPHRHFVKGPEGVVSPGLARIWLFVIAITIHNFPEGLAVGLGFGGGDVANGLTLAVAIGLQNMPEGLAVAVALRREQYAAGAAFLVALLTGAVEPIGGLIGLGAVSLATPILPYGLAFAAGAMLFVVSDEIIPETHRRCHERLATYAVMAGFAVMMALDTALA